MTMKALVLATTLAALSMSFSAPLQAASVAPAFSLELLMDGSFDRHGRGCDSRHDIREHPRCTPV
jgi:hypothetical protein